MTSYFHPHPLLLFPISIFFLEQVRKYSPMPIVAPRHPYVISTRPRYSFLSPISGFPPSVRVPSFSPVLTSTSSPASPFLRYPLQAFLCKNPLSKLRDLPPLSTRRPRRRRARPSRRRLVLLRLPYVSSQLNPRLLSLSRRGDSVVRFLFFCPGGSTDSTRY